MSPGDVGAPRDEAGVVLARRLRASRSRLGTLWYSKTCERVPIASRPPRDVQAHRALELAEVGVDAVAVAADRHELARLVGGDQQGAAELAEDLGEVGAVDAAQRRRRRRVRVDRCRGSVLGAAGERRRSSRGRARRAPSVRSSTRLDLRAPRALLRSPAGAVGGRGDRRGRARRRRTRRSARSRPPGPPSERACSTTHQRAGGRRSRSVSRIRVAIAHCSATISAGGPPGQVAPLRRQEQRPGRAVPARQLRDG